MKVIAVLDFEHLDNGVFLNAFAQSLARQQVERCIVVHSDSEYTDRLIQTGMMREDAQLRSIRDLNHRLIALFADNGVPTIGINGYQRSFIQWDGEHSFLVDRDYYEKLSDKVVLLLSNLVQNTAKNRPATMPLPEFSHRLKQTLDYDEVIVFSTDEKDEILVQTEQSVIQPDELSEEEHERFLPVEFRDDHRPIRVMNSQQFGELSASKKPLNSGN
jgi:hypothetical protein